MRVLVVDDCRTTVELLEACLSEFGYDVAVARNGLEALDLVRTGLYRLVVSDWEMPEMSGLELCRAIRQRQTSDYVYLILLTSHSGTRRVVEGLNAGADDFISKPFEPDELRVRLRSAERVLALESRELLIFSLAKLAESRDPETGAHLERIRLYSKIIPEHLAKMAKFRDVVDGEYIQLIYQTSPLHDIGKVGIPDSVLLKAGQLTPSEFEIMKQHTTLGAETLSAALRLRPDAAFLTMARDIAWCHHEKYDGSGYPRLAGEEIPLCGRIVALADVYDALTTRRVYKPAYSHEQAYEIIAEGRGKHFDPDVVDAFLANEHRFVEVRQQLEAVAAPVATDRPLTAAALTLM